MGGLIIIIATIIPVLLFSNFKNIYIIILIFTTIWLGFIGFLDDYIKVFKKNKDGLKGKFKIIGQISLGFIIGLTLCYHQDVTIKDENKKESYRAPSIGEHTREVLNEMGIDKETQDKLRDEGAIFWS